MRIFIFYCIAISCMMNSGFLFCNNLLPQREENLSEFESRYPDFSIRIMPGLITVNELYMRINYVDSNNNIIKDKDMRISSDPLSLTAEVLFRYSQFNANASFSGNYSIQNNNNSSSFCFNGGAGLGFFGSLSIISVEGYFMNWSYKSTNEIVMSDLPGTTNSSIIVPMPDVLYQAAWAGLSMRFNISQNYYLLLKSGFSIFMEQIGIRLKKSGLYPAFRF